MDSDPSFNQCGFYCYVSIDQCDFFAMELDYCHLGRYSYDGNSDGVHTELVTYHKSGCEFSSNSQVLKISYLSSIDSYIAYMDPLYWSLSGNHWKNFIYKYTSRSDGKKCQWDCYLDEECDFYVDYYYCYYGKFSYTGDPITSIEVTNDNNIKHGNFRKTKHF